MSEANWPSDTLLRLWFMKGFFAASKGKTDDPDDRGEVKLYEAYQMGAAHYHKLVNDEDKRLNAAFTTGEGFPPYKASHQGD